MAPVQDSVMGGFQATMFLDLQVCTLRIFTGRQRKFKLDVGILYMNRCDRQENSHAPSDKET